MNPLPRILIPLALLTGGILAGRALSTGGVADSSPSTGNPGKDGGSGPARPARPQPAGTTGKAGDRRGLAALRAARAADGATPAELRKALERVDLATLRTVVMDEYLTLAEMVDGKERPPHQTLYTAAMDELWRRQGISTLEWADQLAVPKERAMMTKSLLRRALKEDPAGAAPWMAKYHAENGKSETNNEFLSLAMKGAAERGAEDVIRAYGMFQDSNLNNPLYDARYPEDFDFARLHAALAGKTDLSEAVSHWALRDPDAAWAAVREGLLKDGAPASPKYPEDLGGLMMAAVARDGEAAGVKWTMDRLATLTREQRELYLQRMEGRARLSAEGIGVIAASLPPEERGSYAARLLRDDGVTARTYAAMDTLPREELLDTLATKAIASGSAPRQSSAVHGERMARIRDELRARYQLTDAEISRIGLGE